MVGKLGSINTPKVREESWTGRRSLASSFRNDGLIMGCEDLLAGLPHPLWIYQEPNTY